MKLLFVLFSFMSFCLFSQRQSAGKNVTTINSGNPAQIENSNPLCDTTSHVAFGVDSTFLFTNTGTGNWGYVSGTNSYKDIAKAEKFFAGDYTAGYQLAGGIFHFAKAIDGSNPTVMQMSAWKNDGFASYPKSSLSSVSVQLASFISDSAITTLFFPNPVPVTGDFYLGLEGFSYSNPQQDTVALYTASSSVFVNTAFEQWVDSSWHAFNEPNNWNLKAHFFIAAILCNTDVGTYELLNPSDKILLFPNPGTDNITLSVGQGFSDKAQIKIFDVSGKLVFEDDFILLNGNCQLRVSAFQKGVYRVRVECPEGIRYARMIIQ